MTKILTPEQFNFLRSIDTPTLCNAIERFEARGRVEGFMGMDIRCLLPGLGVMAGYAVTVKVDSTTPGVKQDPQAWYDWLKAMQDCPGPGVLVFQDVGPQPRKSAHFGEVMGTTARRLGMVGLVTDGGVRDVLELERLGFHAFAAGLVPAHGNPRLLEVNIPVVLDGVTVRPGELIHGDVNGVTTVPESILSQLPEAVEAVRRKEAATMGYINGPEFSIDGLQQRKFAH
jgi:regulator of RNase E activity RraA